MAKILKLDESKYNLENEDPNRLNQFDNLTEEEIEKRIKEIEKELKKETEKE